MRKLSPCAKCSPEACASPPGFILTLPRNMGFRRSSPRKRRLRLFHAPPEERRQSGPSRMHAEQPRDSAHGVTNVEASHASPPPASPTVVRTATDRASDDEGSLAAGDRMGQAKPEGPQRHRKVLPRSRSQVLEAAPSRDRMYIIRDKCGAPLRPC